MCHIVLFEKADFFASDIRNCKMAVIFDPFAPNFKSLVQILLQNLLSSSAQFC